MKNLLDLRNVGFGYSHGTAVLEDVNLRLDSGERVALQGGNGSGKTTLLHLVVGLLRPDRGKIIAFGKDRCCEADFIEVRQRAGLLFQDPEDQLFCPTVVEDVAFGPLNLGKSAAQAVAVATETLHMLGLNGYEHRVTHHLSGGEKRLVSLAAVLAMQPDVLLLDEPTCGLDEKTESRLQTILSSLPQAMIIVSHERNFLAPLVHRSVCLRNGCSV